MERPPNGKTEALAGVAGFLPGPGAAAGRAGRTEPEQHNRVPDGARRG